MSYTPTTKLGLLKADPGTNQPFETTVFNDNLDAVDAEFVAVDGRFNAVEAYDVLLDGRLDALEAVGSGSRLDAVEDKNFDQDGHLGSIDGALNSIDYQQGVQDARLNAIESDNWVTNARIADNAVDANELASTLNLTGKTINVATQPQGYGGNIVASCSFVSTAINTMSASDRLFTTNSIVNSVSSHGTPAKQVGYTVTATPSSGVITVDLTVFGFPAVGSNPVVTANIYQPGTTKFVVGIQSVSPGQVQFKVLTSTGANATVSTRIDFIAVVY